MPDTHHERHASGRPKLRRSLQRDATTHGPHHHDHAHHLHCYHSNADIPDHPITLQKNQEGSKHPRTRHPLQDHGHVLHSHHIPDTDNERRHTGSNKLAYTDNKQI